MADINGFMREEMVGLFTTFFGYKSVKMVITLYCLFLSLLFMAERIRRSYIIFCFALCVPFDN